MKTEEEIQQLLIDRSNAKIRMKDVWESLQQMRKMIKLFETDYLRWSNRYERADRALAEEDGRLKKHSVRVKKEVKLEVELTRDQLLAIAKTLGINLNEVEKEIEDERSSESDEKELL